MAPTRERPGIVRVRISDRDVWHVVDPALSPTEAAEAVRAHRAANAPTNRTAPRRVLAWTPGLVALVVLAAAVVGTVVVTRELDLAELPARITVAAALGLVGFFVAAVAGIALLDAPWRRDEPAPEPQRSPHVVPVDDAVRRWATDGVPAADGVPATDGVPAADVWRVVGALALVGELEAARWRLSDCLYGRLDAGATGGEDPADDDVPDVGAVPGEHPAETALWAARARAEEALVAVGEEVGYPNVVADPSRDGSAVSEFLEDVPEGTPGHGDEFVRGESARVRGESALERDPRTDTRWLVVDESLPRPELQAALRDALTWPRGALASALPALVGVAATLGGGVGVVVAVGGLDLVEWPSWAGLGSVGAAAAGITAYGVLGWHAHERAAARRRAATRVARAAVVEVPAAFAGWARAEGRTLRHDDLVALARALSATRAAASTLDAWRWGEPDVDWPHADAVVDPVLLGEYEAARAVLDELATRHGWTVPAEVAPESLR